MANRKPTYDELQQENEDLMNENEALQSKLSEIQGVLEEEDDEEGNWLGRPVVSRSVGKKSQIGCFGIGQLRYEADLQGLRCAPFVETAGPLWSTISTDINNT